MKLRWKKEYTQDFCPLDFPDSKMAGLVPVRMNRYYIAMCVLEYFDEETTEWKKVSLSWEMKNEQPNS